MRYELWMALRHLRARRNQSWIGFTSWISVAGVALGVLALIVVLAVMSGLEEDLREKILASNAHLVVDKADATPIEDYRKGIEIIEGVPGVEAASPYVLVKAMVRSGSFTDGIALRGVDPERVGRVLTIDRQMVQGSMEGLRGLVPGELPDDKPVPGIVLGEILASSLRVFVGERIQLLIPGAVSTPLGRKPRVRTFQVVGIFRTQVYEVDAGWAYTNLEGAQGLLALGDRASGFEAKLLDPFGSERVAEAVRTAMGEGLRVQDWKELNRAFFWALETERRAMFLLLCLIVMVAAFNIVSTLTMKVMERTKEIGVLKSLGATEGSVLAVFLYEGLSIGLSGTVVGFVIGTPLCWLADHNRWITAGADLYNLSYLPFRLEAGNLIAVAVASMLISLATTLYPSWQASRLDPVEAMRAE